MLHQVLVEDFTEVSADSAVEVVQDSCKIRDTIGIRLCRLHTLVTAASANAILSIEGASTLGGPWVQLVSSPAAGGGNEAYYALECDSDAQYMLYRYLRWRATVPTAGVICFMVDLEFADEMQEMPDMEQPPAGVWTPPAIAPR